MTAPVWMASPPEVHSVLLSSGPGPGSLLAAAGAWAALSTEYASAASDLTSLLASVQAGAWQGPSAEEYVSAHLPFLAWLTEASANSAGAAAQHEVAAAAYTTALAAMPTIPELATNHVIHGVLIATNFFGLNTIPIAVNEADYVRMWIQAATTMATYQAISGASLASAPRTEVAPPVLKTNDASPAAVVPPTGDFFLDIYNQLVQLIEDPSGTLSAIFSNPATYFPLLFFVAYQVFSNVGAAITYPLLIAGSIMAVVIPFVLQMLTANPEVLPLLTAPAGGQTAPQPAQQVSPVVVTAPAAAGTAATPAPSSAAGAAGGAAPAAAPAAGFPYMVGGMDPGGDPGPTLIDRDENKAPGSAIPAAAAAFAVSRDKTRSRRRRRAEMHDHADEFADMNVDVNPDWGARDDRDLVSAAVASGNGSGALGFSGTVEKDSSAEASGLATLSSNGFGSGPRMPMVPGTWDPETSEGEGEHG
ncbi:PPE family protein [Mycobacterium sp.]|uniref:PPE family protein n=1 Tax=Mycobacterium sp. TaxID=1785 RepID=UPI0025CDB234|nr:PPE family protein [Mycobacterium sp.]